MREIEDGLRQVGRLHDAADFDRALFLDQLADDVQQVRGELLDVSITNQYKTA